MTGYYIHRANIKKISVREVLSEQRRISEAHSFREGAGFARRNFSEGGGI
jgi:hypothetical protein